jgi:hypothetical protein
MVAGFHISMTRTERNNMMIRFTNLWLCLTVLSGVTATKGQGTINFDAHNNWVGTNYYELGMQFRVIIPGGGSYYDDMGISYGAGNTPYDGTPFMDWYRQNNPSDYVALSLTNGSTFGLTSVWLADPTAPSLSPVSISFIGSLGDGSTVTNTFVTPGGGATSFLDYTFTSAFASGLTSVKIDAPRWAMDNLVFTIPEPSAVSLVLLGGGIFGYVRTRKRHSARK